MIQIFLRPTHNIYSKINVMGYLCRLRNKQPVSKKSSSKFWVEFEKKYSSINYAFYPIRFIYSIYDTDF